MAFTSRERKSTNHTRETQRNGRRSLKRGKGFADAIAKNDPEGIERFVTDEWIIINADGGIIDKERFLGVIKSGALTHEMMESDDIRVRVFAVLS
jgi:hypothetical protein